LIFISFRPKII